VIPTSKWANLQLVDLESRYCNGATKALALLEIANKPISLQKLRSEIFSLFGVDDFKLVSKNGSDISEDDLQSLSGETIFVAPVSKTLQLPEVTGIPFCKVFNFVEQNVSGTLILENPSGHEVLNEKDYKQIINQWVKTAKA